MYEAIINGLAGIGIYCFLTTTADIVKEVYRNFFSTEKGMKIKHGGK